jgi:hypothetical protein
MVIVLTQLPFFVYICGMKEILYKKEITYYNTNKYLNHNSIEEYKKDIEINPYLHTSSPKRLKFTYDSCDSSEECFAKNYGNPLCEIIKSSKMVVVEKYEDKVSLKVFTNYRIRKVGNVWFKLTKNMSYVTINLKTGDVYNGGIDNYHLKRKCRKRIKRNIFIDVLENMGHYIRHSNFFDNQIEDKEGVKEIISIFTSQFTTDNDLQNLSYDDRLFKFYLDKRNIKIPNNFYVFRKNWIGPEIRKLLKKNDNKMIDAIMSRYEFSGKKIKKVLHKCENFNHKLYQSARMVFGDDWMNQDEDVILGCLNSDTWFSIDERFLNLASKEEMRKLFMLFKQMVIHNTINSYTLRDHTEFYCQLKLYGENDLKWVAKDDKSLIEEHAEWSTKIEHYRNGTYTRIYPEYSYDHIQTPIDINGTIYYPKLLDNSENYNQESSVQSNCVKTYINKPASIIVSLRKDDLESIERATIEYRVSKCDDEVQIKRAQSLGRFNEKLNSNWDEPLFKLDEIMLSYVKEEHFDKVQINKECSNGFIIEYKIHWNDNGHLQFDDNMSEMDEIRLNGLF